MQLLYRSNTGGYSERDAAVVFRIVLEALKYMHVKRIVHRDIKLENLMLARHGDPYSVKIADFGFACDLDANGCFSGMAGTPAYLAPEVWLALFTLFCSQSTQY
jgi:calcium/calmodulin-dependent protein kinase I